MGDDRPLYLDTHVVVWLYDGDLHKLSGRAKALINSAPSIRIPGAVYLELCFLFEIGRIRVPPADMVGELQRVVGAHFDAELTALHLMHHAAQASWTRDPFDRLIASEALLGQGLLLTKDETIRSHFAGAVWD